LHAMGGAVKMLSLATKFQLITRNRCEILCVQKQHSYYLLVAKTRRKNQTCMSCHLTFCDTTTWETKIAFCYYTGNIFTIHFQQKQTTEQTFNSYK